ncbi:ribonuclease J [Novosphingobium sp. BK486]|nr:ribonuclease J [Novosphingobium sp. BK256]MBB3374897.1 ribonuclease J [Novosphingobium sp. BK280]MBB3379414.1 ribonuclease J [Novosphingobium sp. BK258]MBB3421109.1 ribonuclease J [Novosphingobium sp. BK267]MBB3449318.1 ribonuclease J [Novosphingobium sp. BK352]MBB3478277.1 ribonuclease J [Novosphingobium sp. BK369]MBB3501485.1 ribonuclease J [Novosphingobium sp. BK336]MBB3537374.1 ribonuclease J [Novosphingobium sp. BK486]MBB3556666.1 ribonuclease J [Novosphingobium sp. BK349]MBB359828
MKPGKELLFLALGGSGEIGMNVNLYGCDGKWLMVDLGMTFADPWYPGVELVFADLEFIEARKKDLLGIVLTHAHEDHIGAVPYFAQELGVPLYATPFTARLVNEKLVEAGIENSVELNVIQNEGSLSLGAFDIRYVPLAHSIAEGNALVIDTPYGRVFHTGDWKLDDEPRVGTPATEEELTAIGDEGVLALVCDSTNVFNPKPSGSEGAVRAGLLETIAELKGRRVVVTTFASNVARLQTLAEVAEATGRQLCVAGRSLDRIIKVSQASGYLLDFPDPISMDAAMDLPRGEVLILATGGQGEARAALARIAGGQHPISLESGDAVVFSSRQIPGNELAIGRVQNALVEKGVRLITDKQSMIHVSGHPGRPELVALYDWLRPKILVPVHGEIRHMAEQAALGKAEGIPKTILQKNGDLVRLAPNGPVKLSTERNGRLVLDGDIIAPADGEAMAARRKLGNNGLVSVALAVTAEGKQASGVDIGCIGVPLEEDMEPFLEEAREDVSKALKALKGDRKRDRLAVAECVRLAVRRTAQRWSGKKPVVQVLLRER